MSKNLTSNQKFEIAKPELKTRILVTIFLDDGPLRILENDTVQILTINGDDYLAGMVTRSDIETAVGDTVEKVTITISNIWQDISSLIANKGDTLTNRKCKVEEVIFLDSSGWRKSQPYTKSWQVSAEYPQGKYITPTSNNGCVYKCTAPGISGDTEPVWSQIIGGKILDGSVEWTCLGKIYISPSNWNGYVYEYSIPGVTGEVEPIWPTIIDETVTDGSVEWTCKNPIIDDPVLLFEGLINNIQLTAMAFSFDVERVLGGYSTVSPNTTYDVNCQWKFKDERCCYLGSEPSCDKTWTTCRIKERFGGYPSIPKEMVISTR